jgi:hypothetical protein
VIAGPASGSGQAANDDERGALGDKAAAVLGAFEGVRLDAEAEAAIAAALEACAARAREADSAYEKGGDAAVEAAADDPQVPFVRADLFQGIAIGALEPVTPPEEFVPFVPGEAPWELAGAEKPVALIAMEERIRSKGPERKAPDGRRERGRERGKSGGARSRGD